jgi:hypothetical protein
MVLQHCDRCRSEHPRQTAGGLCCECLHAELTAAKLAAATDRICYTDGVTLDVADLAPQSLEGFSYVVPSDGNHDADPICSIFRLRLHADRGNFYLGKVALPLDGVRVLQATAEYGNFFARDELTEQLLPAGLTHSINITVMDAPGAAEDFHHHNRLPPSITPLMAAFDLDLRRLLDLTEPDRR